MFVADTVVDMRDVLEFSPGAENELLDNLEETLTEEELLFLEEETKLAKLKLETLRYMNIITSTCHLGLHFCSHYFYLLNDKL